MGEQLQKVLKLGKDLQKALKGWEQAIQSGNLADIEKFAKQAVEVTSGLAEPTVLAAQSWSFDARLYLSSNDWLDELQAAAKEDGGVNSSVGSNELICSPIVVRSSPSQAALRIPGRPLWKKLRPRMVVAELKKITSKSTGKGDQVFLDQLSKGAEYLSRGRPTGAMLSTKIRDIYDLFSLAPGWKNENPKLAFCQALYSLHLSDVRVTRAGRKYEFEFPSGHPKADDLFSVTAHDGTPREYYMIHFR